MGIESAIDGKIHFYDLAGLHPKQRAIIDAMKSRPNPVILGGGSGFGGKSRGLRAAAVYWHLWLYKHGFHGHETVFASSSYEALRDRHFAYFAGEWGEFGEIMLSHKIHGRCFKFHNPKLGAICFRNLADPNERRGTEYSAGFIDEQTELTRAIYGAFSYMIRRPGLPIRPIVGMSNPDGVGFGWNKALFRPECYRQSTGELVNEAKRLAPYPANIDASGELDPADHLYIPFLPDDNPTFDEKTFWRMVAHLPEHIQRARRHGTWDAPEGARWNYLDPEVHLFSLNDVFPQGIPMHWPRILHCDYGLRAPYCALWTAIDYDGNPWTYRERYRAGMTADAQIVDIMEATGAREQITAAYADPAMWAKLPGHNPKPGEELLSTIDMYHAGTKDDGRFPSFVPGFNRSRVIAMTTLDKLLRRGNGHPDWHIEVGCVNLWNELSNATYPTGTALQEQSEDIDPRNPDHAITAAYYGLHTHLQLPPTARRDPTPQEIQAARRREMEQRDLKMFARSTGQSLRKVKI